MNPPRSSYVLYTLLLMLIGAIALAFIYGIGRVSRVATQNQVLVQRMARVARQNQALVQRLHTDEVNQLKNRAENVSTWCGAINRTDAVLVHYVDAFRAVMPVLPALPLRQLPCSSLRAKTTKSGSAGR